MSQIKFFGYNCFDRKCIAVFFFFKNYFLKKSALSLLTNSIYPPLVSYPTNEVFLSPTDRHFNNILK